MGSTDTERCGIIVYNGGPGDINHAKGAPMASTTCPINLWDTTELESRLSACRQCQYYLAPGIAPKKVY